MIERDRIANNIKELRRKKKWRVTNASYNTGIPRKRLELLENNKRIATNEELFKISRAYGIIIDELVFGEFK